MSSADPISLESFARSWRALGGSRPARAYGELVRRYGAPSRAYHDLEHVADCLRWALRLRAEMEDAAACEVALWFHDAVQNGGGGDDVGASADRFAELATEAGIPVSAIGRVRQRIEATCHDGRALSGDDALVADIDLAILGSDPARFARYEAGVRREHSHVDEATFRRARATLLRSFLERLSIYHTDRFARRLEAQARENLARSLRQLDSAPR